MNYWIRYTPDSVGNQWLACYIDPHTGQLDYAGPYLTAEAALIVARWQAHN